MRVKDIIEQLALGAGLVCLLFIISCDGKSEITDEEGCVFEPVSSCAGFSFSIVEANTYENLIGEENLIHPDSIVIINTRNDTMPGYFPLKFSDGWYTIEDLDPFREITCFNQCLSDSAFTRTYYMYIGNGDTDTIDVFFPERSGGPEVFFNGDSGEVPDDRPPETGLGYSPFWFRKKL